MRFLELLAFAAATSAAAVGVARAGSSAELLDLAARVHYGYYHGEPRAIAAAQAGFERLGDTPEVVYQRDFAALRRAQLGARDREALRGLSECADRDVAAMLSRPAATEAWVLVAACAFVAEDERRFELALARARAHDADHPRIGLIEAWALQATGAGSPPQSEALAEKWGEVVAAFDAFGPSLDDPGWGHAEALAAFADNALMRGEIRAARDLIERALLLAPGYRAAVDLRAELQASQKGSRPP